MEKLLLKEYFDLPSEENLAVIFFEKYSQRMPRFPIRRITRPFDGPVLKTSYACEVFGHNTRCKSQLTCRYSVAVNPTSRSRK
jgi:hypothetical protein